MTSFDTQAAFSGTKEVAGPLRFDVARLAAYLAAQENRNILPRFAGPLAVRQFKGGQSNPTYLLETPERRYVLRRKPPGKLLASAHAVDREFRVIAALHRQGFPVPEPLVYCDDASVVGTAFFVMGHVDGRIFWDPQLPGSDAAERAAIYDAVNATIARLHSFDPAAIGLADYGRGENYVARQVERWSTQYRASETETIDDMERLIAWLPRNLPPGGPGGLAGPVRLVHGDFRLDNVIMAADAPVVRAVIDWELSTLGDPLADFSYHLMKWHMPEAEDGPPLARGQATTDDGPQGGSALDHSNTRARVPAFCDPSSVLRPTSSVAGPSSVLRHPSSVTGTGSLMGCDLKALGVPSMSQYVDAYAARTGLDPRPHLAVYLAYNFFRIAAIYQGIVGRVRDGTATSEFASGKARMVRPLAATARSFAIAAGAADGAGAGGAGGR
jgi:aminoglycoside phosphotransferase (APT) family kinase protein